MTTQQALQIARRNAALTGNASAVVCYNDALRCAERGLDKYAVRRALASLGHSVGIFHADYRAVKVFA